MTTITDATRRARVASTVLPLASPEAFLATTAFFSVFGGNFLRNLFGWWGWAAIVVTLVMTSVSWLAPPGRARVLLRLPKPLLAFVAFAAASVVWSQWAFESALGVSALVATAIAAVPIALGLSWNDLVACLSFALRWLVALSLGFEVFVAVVVGHPVLPTWITWTTVDDAPDMLLWSRNLLLEGGQIQGVVGNSSVLAGIALMAFIVVAVQLASRLITLRLGLVWLAMIVITLDLTRSATMAIAGAVVVIVAALALGRRWLWMIPRSLFYTGVWSAIALAALVAWGFWGDILDSLGKSDDLTGRFHIWDSVARLAVQHPLEGWGWLGYWAPWISPLNTVATVNGVVQLHAHNAWLDLWLQVGLLGTAVFLLFAVLAARRSLTHAVHRVRGQRNGRPAYLAITMLPLLLLTVLAVQSLTESRLLVEEGLLLVSVLAIKLHLDPFDLETAVPSVALSERKAVFV